MAVSGCWFIGFAFAKSPALASKVGATMVLNVDTCWRCNAPYDKCRCVTATKVVVDGVRQYCPECGHVLKGKGGYCSPTCKVQQTVDAAMGKWQQSK